MKNHKNTTKNPTQNSTTIEWIRDHSKETPLSLINRFPQIGDKISKIRAFAVKEHERAILLKNGEFVSELESGTYQLDKNSRKTGTEIIWIDTTLHNIPWGIPQINGIATKDGFIIGMFGELKIHIVKPLSFYKYVVGGATTWNLSDLKNWIKGLLHTSLRDIFKDYNLIGILKENREIVINKVTGKIIDEFYLYGLILDSFNVLGFKAPGNAKNLLESDQKVAIFKNQINQKEKHLEIEDFDLILNRVSSLKQRLVRLQDSLLENQITKDEYLHQKQLLTLFLQESKLELTQYKKSHNLPVDKMGDE